MAPYNEDQLNQIRDERREQILAAALGVFARRGPALTKMSMIAAAAGISHGLLYHYFKSKDELFTELVRRAMEGASEGVGDMLDHPGTVTDKLRHFLQDAMTEEARLSFLLIHQTRASEGVPEEARTIIGDYSILWFVERLRPLFLEGQRTGEIAEDDAGLLISGLLTAMSGSMILHASDEQNIPLLNPDHLLRMVLAPAHIQPL
ncbi:MULTISPECIES: TetR/AcrR family transcriptional regulator [unclassified Paenibacillus]|uniref:TetR/AcrR family transcriptional regulator n=1 Tax=unclassified Paenibacillus TaxID=185978 RepID=UPI000955834F|nr:MULTISPECIES: TetR/AcrR family transcriptional regulator [unclassified Paenibacillus]ASS65183.1 TetR/AcrR family transcriptional regulator [Paenibacillus sp. RUD330]SIQ45148.1 transcriptional regulator, TetR family [Paenibacillus sp. RU4X]SIQ67372.1 transcriptional regulator, TetR family [Paenibacillus sp. RU4T]